MDMYFSQYNLSSAVSTIVYIYASDQHTILGQSAPFTPTAATWPSGTWCHATFSNVPYNGEFYALVDMFPYNSNMENYFNVYNTTPQPPGYPLGLGWSDIDGTWTLMVNSSIWTGPTSVTFLQRANVCENVVAGIKKLTPESISMYPNPATDKITFEIAEDQAPSQLSIMNLNGQEVLASQLTEPKTQIDISSLPSGVYFVKLLHDKTMEIGKFIKR
jgi:hypothetical protein